MENGYVNEAYTTHTSCSGFLRSRQRIARENPDLQLALRVRCGRAVGLTLFSSTAVSVRPRYKGVSN